MRIALLQNFANYQNRAVRHFEELDEYIAATPAGGARIYDRINFKERDGIATSQIVNLAANDPGIKPDYLVVVEDDSDRILSRWFVTEWYLKRGRQYEASLVRDIISDNWQSVARAPANIIRGWCSAANDAIFNSEGASLSQVKQTEHLLKDRTGSAWVVAYVKNYNSGATADEITFYSAPGIVKSEPEAVTAMFDGGIAGMGYAYDRQMADRKIVTHCADLPKSIQGIPYAVQYTMTDTRGYRRSDVEISSPTSECSWYFPVITPIDFYWNAFSTALRPLMESNHLWEYVDAAFASKELTNNMPWNDEVDQFIGQKFYDPSNRPYVLTRMAVPSKVLIKTSATNIDWWSDKVGHIVKSADLAAQAVTSSYVVVKDPFGAAPVDYVEVEVMTYTYVRQYVGLSENKVTLALNHATLTDRPWGLCAMPVDSINIKNRSSQTTPNLALSFAAAISEQLGEKVLDVQLLPYCPCPDFIDGNAISLVGLSEHIDYEWVRSGDNLTTILLWSRKCSGRISIPFTQIRLPDDPVEYKIEQESKLYRLTAPNYGAAWDFSVSKNRGIYAFDADFTYEPYNSYLRVAPHFGGLYGANFGDCRGLVISSNFSLPKISDAWVNYQLNNSNYQKTFDRQVKSMERARNASLVSAGVNAAAGAAINLAPGISTAIKATNMMYSAADAAIWGDTRAEQAAGEAQFWSATDARSTAFKNMGLGATQSAQAVASSAIGAYLQTKAIEDETYLRELKLGDIKAMPDVITQIGAFNINNKLFPLLEIYDATASEKASLRSYLERRSFDIGRTATVEDYLNYDADRTWIEAALLEVPDFTGDAHELAFLKSELSQGVYIYG